MTISVNHYPVMERLSWRQWVTPKLLKDKPIHRWFTFPHSYTGELVHTLINEWGLNPEDHILDPFVGAGTTLLAAKEVGIPATGFDLSPLAVLTSNTKVAEYDLCRLKRLWDSLEKSLSSEGWKQPSKDYPELVKKALPGRILDAFDTTAVAITYLPCSEQERDFFRLALLATIPTFSRAVATGGWLKWEGREGKEIGAESFLSKFKERIDLMIGDVRHAQQTVIANLWRAHQADARSLPVTDPKFSAIITSPPYPNRHDYTRVFGVELMFGFLNWEETRKLRYQSFHSHPEARPVRLSRRQGQGCPYSAADYNYTPPKSLENALEKIKKAQGDTRVLAMLKGYFLDMYLCLKEMRRVSRAGARIALVVGNAQYYGVPVLVDELTADVGKQVGLICEGLLVVRNRGNSAQQMGRFGRRPSRESVVLFCNPVCSPYLDMKDARDLRFVPLLTSSRLS